MEKVEAVVERARVLAGRLERAVDLAHEAKDAAGAAMLNAALNEVRVWLNDVEDAELKVRKFGRARVVRGRKVPIGFEGVVIWIGDGKYGMRVGIKNDAGEVAFMALGNVVAVLNRLPEKPRFAAGSFAKLVAVEEAAVAKAEAGEAVAA